MSLIKVIIADDHPMVVTGLQTMLKAKKHISVIGTCRDGRSLLRMLEKMQPDVLLLDLQLPDILGKDLAEKILREYPDIRIVILTSLEATHHVEDILEIGCVGYLLKANTDHRRLIRAMEQAYANELFIDETLSELMLANVRKKKKAQEDAVTILTRREKEVLDLIIKENKNQDIADKLHISIRTVECHRLSLLQKLKVKNTVGLVKKAVELRLTNQA